MIDKMDRFMSQEWVFLVGIVFITLASGIVYE